MDRFKIFHISQSITNLAKYYFNDVKFCIKTQNYTSWQRVEKGIMVGCTISPSAFTMVIEMFIRASKWVVEGGEQAQAQAGKRHPPISAYMDDITTFMLSHKCAKRIIGKYLW